MEAGDRGTIVTLSTKLTIVVLEKNRRPPYSEVVDASVDLNQLQDVVQKYVSQYNLLVAAGPVTAASVVKMFTKNKMANLAVVGGGVWFAIQELSTPMLKLMNDQFGYLQSIFSMFRG